MKFFDCNCSFGNVARPAFRYARKASDIVEEMEFCGIDKALVYHGGLRFGSPSVWNQITVEQTKSFKNLEPTWAILPSQTGEQTKPEKFALEMKASK